MRFNMNIKRSGIIALTAALICVLPLTGCRPLGAQDSSGGYSAVSSISEPPGGSAYSDSAEISAPESVLDNESSGQSVSDKSDISSELDVSSVSAVVDPSSDTNLSVPESSVSNLTPPLSSSTPTSSVVVSDPNPPAEVVIPDFPVPVSSGEKVFSSSGGWVDYSNASKGYISAMYTGTKLRSKLRVSANGETPYDFDLSVGGVIQYFPLSFGSGTYTVMMFEQIEGNTYGTLMRNEFEVNITDPLSPYMYSNRYVKYDKNSKCVYKAAELCTGKTDSISKIAAIFGWVSGNISYDNQLAATVPKTYYPDPDNTYYKRTGICYDYASLMAAMLRSQGIPARLVKGYAGDLKHAWNEVYTEQTGWITPELLLKNNGYNTVDATFYAGSSDKEKIAEYISNPSNYTAVNYY